MNEIQCLSLLSLQDRENELLYFKMKKKYGYEFNMEEKTQFQENILSLLNKEIAFQEAEQLIVPETGNECLKEIVALTGKEVVYLKKAQKAQIIEQLMTQPMMKAERAKLIQSIEEMETVKMALIAGNQRKRLVTCLFEELFLTSKQKQKNTLFLDDSIFSGFTFLAAQHRLKELNHHNLVLFNRQIQ